MIKRPNAVGLVLCQQAIIEEKTRNVTLVNGFGRFLVEGFPSPPQQFTVQTILTDGLGKMSLTLTISRLDTLEAIYTRLWRMNWTDPLREMRLLAEVTGCSFPVAGRYQVSLLAQNEFVTQGLLTLAQAEEGP
jgi:hypothetical protein